MKNIGAIVFSLLVVAASAASAQEKVQFPVGASSKTLGYSPLWVAAKQGFFDQQGLDGQVILLRGTPQAVQALIAGSLYVASGGPESFVEVSERGVDTVFIGGIIPDEDVPRLKELGVTGIYGPGAPTDDIIRDIRLALAA